MDVNIYMAKQYGRQPCWELVADVCAAEIGEISVDYKTANRSVREMAGAFRIAIHTSAHGFAQVASPEDMAIVLLGKNNKIGIHHCGIYYQGKVLHAMPDVTMYEELSAIQDRFEVVEFWVKA